MTAYWPYAAAAVCLLSEVRCAARQHCGLRSLLGGAAVVEIVFSWPGLGYLAVQSIIYRDFQLVQGIVLWIALMYMVINLVVDISYNRLDPRLRKEGR